MTGHRLGIVMKARPALLRWHDSPITRAGMALRWLAWLAAGWQPTTAALAAFAAVVAFAVPWLAAITVTAGVWTTVFNRSKTTTALIALAGLVGSLWWTWHTSDTLVRLALIGLIGVWPIDALTGFHHQDYRLRRWWCEFRRGLPIRYAIMAAKATRIQGVVGGERQILDGRRPILDHPAIARRPVFEGDTAWAICSVPPGRNAEAFQDVLEETAASFVNIQRMELVFVDNYQSHGYLIITFGPPLLNTAAAPKPAPTRITELMYRTAPHIALSALTVIAAWTAVT